MSIPVEAAVVLALLALGPLALSARVQAGARRLVIDYGVVVLFIGFIVIGVWLFLNRDSEFLRALLRQYWLPALFAIFILEGAMMMYFAPSEAIVPFAISVARTTDVAEATPFMYAIIILTSVTGATIGQFILFRVSKRWGREWLLQKPWFRVSASNLNKFDSWLERWGPIAIPVSNTLPFARGMLTIPAGLAEMEDRRFVFLSAAGTLVFETILALLTLGVISAVPLVG